MNALATALRHHQAGRLRQAEAVYREILRCEPEHPEALQYLGVLTSQLGRHRDAVEYIRRAIAIRPDKALFHHNLGNVWQEHGQLEEAVACYRRAVQIDPHGADGYVNLGSALHELGQIGEAIKCYRQALAIKPMLAEAHYNLANALRDSGRVAEAVVSYRQTILLQPEYARAHHNLGEALKRRGELREAIKHYQQALLCEPDETITHCEIGAVRYRLGELDQALAALRQALQRDPDHLPATLHLFATLQRMCLWGELEVVADRLRKLVQRQTDDPGIATAALALSCLNLSAEQHLHCARKWVDGLLEAAAISAARYSGHAPAAATSRIAVGYLSADFHRHATAYLLAELIEQHDRSRFQVFGYSYGPDDGSPMRRRLVKAFDQFVDIRDLCYADAAERIASDEIQILLDLKGHTKDARPEIMALRPAPIQVAYLGYPGTMGAPFIDYLMVDRFVVPPDQQPFYTEKLVHLPGCYQVNDSQRVISSHTPTRVECHLPQEGFVFCCFNDNYKITRAVFDVWMRLLGSLPGSVLWLLQGNRFAPGELEAGSGQPGVAPERLIFAARQPLEEHLARHRVADLFLDTFPVNAHTTASDALWAGCPLLTLAGETFVSRVAGSLLHAVGLPELICTSLDQYEGKARELAGSPPTLARVRATLEANRLTCDLFQGEKFARHAERAYQMMWQIHQAGEAPRPFAVSS